MNKLTLGILIFIVSANNTLAAEGPVKMSSRTAILMTQTLLNLHPGSEADAKALNDLINGKKADFPNDQEISIEGILCKGSSVVITENECRFHFSGSKMIHTLFGKDADLLEPALAGDGAAGSFQYHAKRLTCNLTKKYYNAGGGASCTVTQDVR